MSSLWWTAHLMLLLPEGFAASLHRQWRVQLYLCYTVNVKQDTTFFSCWTVKHVQLDTKWLPPQSFFTCLFLLLFGFLLRLNLWETVEGSLLQLWVTVGDSTWLCLFTIIIILSLAVAWSGLIITQFGVILYYPAASFPLLFPRSGGAVFSSFHARRTVLCIFCFFSPLSSLCN